MASDGHGAEPRRLCRPHRHSRDGRPLRNFTLRETNVVKMRRFPSWGAPPLDSRLRGNDGRALDSRLRGNDGRALDSRLRGNDGRALDSRLRGNDRCAMDSRLRGNDRCAMDSRLRGNDGFARVSDGGNPVRSGRRWVPVCTGTTVGCGAPASSGSRQAGYGPHGLA